jgi:hypothetical protein
METLTRVSVSYDESLMMSDFKDICTKLNDININN